MTADWWVRTCNCFDSATEDSGDNYAQSSETDQTPETLAGDERSKGPVYRACHVHRRLDSGSHVSGREPEKTAGSTSELQTGQRCADQRQQPTSVTLIYHNVNQRPHHKARHQNGGRVGGGGCWLVSWFM